MIHLGKSCPNILPRTILADTVNTSNRDTHAYSQKESVLLIQRQQTYSQIQLTLVAQTHTCLQSERVCITNTGTTDLQSDTVNTSSTDTHMPTVRKSRYY